MESRSVYQHVKKKKNSIVSRKDVPPASLPITTVQPAAFALSSLTSFKKAALELLKNRLKDVVVVGVNAVSAGR